MDNVRTAAAKEGTNAEGGATGGKGVATALAEDPVNTNRPRSIGWMEEFVGKNRTYSFIFHAVDSHTFRCGRHEVLLVVFGIFIFVVLSIAWGRFVLLHVPLDIKVDPFKVLRFWFKADGMETNGPAFPIDVIHEV